MRLDFNVWQEVEGCGNLVPKSDTQPVEDAGVRGRWGREAQVFFVWMLFARSEALELTFQRNETGETTGFILHFQGQEV